MTFSCGVSRCNWKVFRCLWKKGALVHLIYQDAANLPEALLHSKYGSTVIHGLLNNYPCYPMNHNILGYCTGFWITRVLSKGNSLSSRIHSWFGRCINWQFQQQKSCFSTGIHETLLYFPNSSGLCLNTLGHNNCAILQARMFTSLTIGDLNLSRQALFLREQISVKGIWHWLWLS